MGLGSDGFSARDEGEIYSSILDKYKVVLGDIVGNQEWIQDLSEFESGLIKDLEDQQDLSYQNAIPNIPISGVLLDQFAAFFDVYREEESSSSVVICIEAEEGLVLSLFKVVDSKGRSWVIEEEYTCSGDDDFVSFLCEEKGEVLLSAGESWSYSYLNGLVSVSNNVDAILGCSRESDESLRLRLLETIRSGSSNSAEVIKKRVEDSSGATQVKVSSNRESIVVDGVPAHSVELVVDGGDHDKIIQSLHETTCFLVGTHGDITDTYKLDDGYEIEYSYSRVSSVSLYISFSFVATEVFDDEDGEGLILSSFIQYISGLSSGATVSRFSLLSSLRSISGISSPSVQFGLSSDSLSTESITLGMGEEFVLLSESVVLERL